MISPTTARSVFIYGSLMAPEVLTGLIGRLPQTNSARLSGYSRHPVKGQVFPAILPTTTSSKSKSSSSSVDGILLLGLTDGEIKALDWFEDVEYQRTPVQVEILQGGIENLSDNHVQQETRNNDNNEILDTEAYVWSNPKSELDLETSWSFEEFQKQHLEWYLQNTVGPCRKEIDLGYHLKE